MAKKYKGSLTLDWFNKQKAIVNLDVNSIKGKDDIPAPRINWINKEEALFYELNEEEGKGNTPYWVNRDDIRVKEARPLIFQKAYKALVQDKKGTLPGTDKEFSIQEIINEEETLDIDNMLIKGDNLLALNTLKKHFDKLPDNEKVKCIYIDPPYNTGSAFDHYDDNLAHSEWLSLMRDRLVVLKELLKDNGVIIVQIDDTELSHLKILMDEVFGRDNFKKIVSVKMSTASGVKTSHRDKTILKEKENLIIFAKDGSTFEVNPQYIPKKEWDTEFQYILDRKESSNPDDWEVLNLNAVLKEKGISKDNTSEEFLDFVLKNADKIWRRAFIRGAMKEKSTANFNKILTKTSSDGKEHYYYKGREMYFLKDSFHNCFTESGFISTMSTLVCDFWSDINTGKLFNEGNVEFRDGKKPEFLLARLFEMFTVENDLILDCFGGSGSSFAVAHKMNRKWIGVEIGNHADTHIIPRVSYVLNGADQSGVSKPFNWLGGGSFKYYHLGGSIINIDKETGKGEFNWVLGKQFIQESLLVSYDFVLQEDINLFPAQLFPDKADKPSLGKISNKGIAIYGVSFLAEPKDKVLTITNEDIKTIYSTLKKQDDFQSVVIYTNKGIDIAQDTIPVDLEIIKVPHAIFAELER
jgi:adenine-specific DNA-methyltransferase